MYCVLWSHTVRSYCDMQLQGHSWQLTHRNLSKCRCILLDSHTAHHLFFRSYLSDAFHMCAFAFLTPSLWFNGDKYTSHKCTHTLIAVVYYYAHTLCLHFNALELLVRIKRNELYLKGFYNIWKEEGKNWVNIISQLYYILKVACVIDLLELISYTEASSSMQTRSVLFGHFHSRRYGHIWGLVAYVVMVSLSCNTGHMGCVSERLPRLSCLSRPAIWRRGVAAELADCVQVTS